VGNSRIAAIAAGKSAREELLTIFRGFGPNGGSCAKISSPELLRRQEHA